MAQLTRPDWQPQTNNPRPKCTTTVAFRVMPGGTAGGVRITYTLKNPQVSFTLPSPGPAGSVPVSQSPSTLVEDHPAFTAPMLMPVNRTLKLETIGSPALVEMDVTVEDVDNGSTSDPNASAATISFAVGGTST